ncbi:substrate-binding domain-containing protein [Carbonactinospora thermoautotrophica]|uniref:substrate-binding domain-containing protein n=1 Tax=Carbonactinospora thermoautotrophica TaxID=1469144 RepID=UPI00227169D3|nr:substrate-binding domain-containing protein [Carbonactinospora thermoautotrophica]
MKLGLISGVVTVAALLGVGGWALSQEGVPSCSEITIAAAPDIAPSLQRIAAGYGERLQESCAEVTVEAVEPEKVARDLAESGTTTPSTLPDVWIPDSSLWLTQARSTPHGALITPDKGASVATSAVVLAMAEPRARPLGWPNLQVTWAQAVQRFRVALPDPTRNAVGLAALIAAQPTAASSPQDHTAYLALLRGLAPRTSPRVTDLVNQVTRTAGRSSEAVAFPVSEQTVWRHNSSNGTASRLAAIYPSDGTPSLDYPYLVLGHGENRAAEEFRRYLITTDARRSLLRDGFRGPDGVPGPQLSRDKGVDPTLPKPVPTPADAAGFALRAWRTATTEQRG